MALTGWFPGAGRVLEGQYGINRNHWMQRVGGCEGDREKQQQIPFGNDNKKSKGNNNSGGADD